MSPQAHPGVQSQRKPWSSAGIALKIYTSQQKKKDGTAILTSDQTIFNLKKAIKNQDGHYLLIKGTIEQELTVISIKDWVSKVCKAFNHKPRKIPEWKHNSSGRLQSATVTMR